MAVQAVFAAHGLPVAQSNVLDTAFLFLLGPSFILVLFPLSKVLSGHEHSLNTTSGQKHKEYRDIIWQDTYLLQHHLPASEAYGCKIKAILETITQPPPHPNDIPPLLRQCISPDTPLLKVEWEHTKEKESGWRRAFPHLVKGLEHKFDLQQQTAAETTSQSSSIEQRNKLLTPQQQQGLQHTQRPYPMTTDIQDMLTIHTDPVNPDRDAKATGNYEIYLSGTDT